jgi:hypothetical protein
MGGGVGRGSLSAVAGKHIDAETLFFAHGGGIRDQHADRP